MAALLPLLTLLCIVLALRQRLKLLDLRMVILLGAVAWGVLLTALTELLSLLNCLNRLALAIAWSAALITSAYFALRGWRKLEFKRFSLDRELLQIFQLFSIAGIALLTGVIAFIAAPNNWDSMVYHLSRVMHWLQNGSVSFYPTGILRQLYLPPWSEYLLANLMGAGVSNRLAQIPQWLGFIGSVVGVSLLAKQLGASPAGQVFSAFAAATLPMGILQATTTQNDALLVFWLVCLVAFILHALQDKHPAWHAAIGGALGLAVLTKSTAYIFALPFLLYYGVMWLNRSRLRFWRPVMVISLLALSINLPHFIRNQVLFGHLLGPRQEVSQYHNAIYSLPGTLSNVSRNLGLYMGTVEPVNRLLTNGFERFHAWLNLSINDPRFTWSDHVFSINSPQVHEDTTGSSLHLLLAAIAFIILAINRKKLVSSQFILYGLLVLSAFLLFCTFLRWQTWHARLHLPLLVLSTAWVGLLSEVMHRRLVWAVSLVLALLVLPVFYFNPNKPLVADYTIFNLPRREVMLMRKNLVVPYIEGVNYLTNEKGCYQVGLYIPNAEWEYPFWRLYADTGLPYRLEHVNVNNVSGSIPMAPFSPCAVIATQTAGEQFVLDGGHVYDLTWSMPPVYVYTK